MRYVWSKADTDVEVASVRECIAELVGFLRWLVFGGPASPTDAHS